MDEDTCMVDMARYFLNFTRDESCGKCRLLSYRDQENAGDPGKNHRRRGKRWRYRTPGRTGGKIKDGSMCGLGQTAPNPVLTTLKYFRNEYEDHIYNKKCTAASCKALISLQHQRCLQGMYVMRKTLPGWCDFRQSQGKTVIDQDLCIKCGKCSDTCKFGAIEKK